MKEINGNLFNHIGDADIICITTNGFVKSNGDAVMGAGCAKTFRDSYAGSAQRLGERININGNVVQIFDKILLNNKITDIYSYPVKHNWWEVADLNLIAKSANQLKDIVNKQYQKDIKVIIPRPGCGNGKLKWEEVKPILEDILDDNRFYIITF